MDYEIPESLRLMQETIRRFVNQDLGPLSQQVEDEDHIPEGVVQKMRELGLFGLSIPEEYGGLDLGTFGECLVYEELTKTNAAFRFKLNTYYSRNLMFNRTSLPAAPKFSADWGWWGRWPYSPRRGK